MAANFEISKTLNPTPDGKGTKLFYIARDPSGVVRFREENLDDLEEAIEKFNATKEEEEPKEEIIEEETPEEESPAPKETPKKGEKKFLENDLKAKVQSRRKQSKKTSFWDKIK